MEKIKNASYLLNKYKDRVPVVIEQSETFKLVLDSYKYLIPKKMTISQYMCIIRNKIKIKPIQALFMMIKNNDQYILAPMSSTLEEIYSLYHDNDGFLYVTFKLENTFG